MLIILVDSNYCLFYGGKGYVNHVIGFQRFGTLFFDPEVPTPYTCGNFFKNERAHQMKQKWTHRELEESWMLSTAELKLLDDVSHKNRLGFALLLKFFQIEGHFPESKKEIPQVLAATLKRAFPAINALSLNRSTHCPLSQLVAYMVHLNQNGQRAIRHTIRIMLLIVACAPIIVRFLIAVNSDS